MTLRRGAYRLAVPKGLGPAGVRRSTGDDIAFDIEGGWCTFQVEGRERVWFWWRGAHRHRSVTLERVNRRTRPVDERAERRREPVVRRAGVETIARGESSAR